MGDNQQQQPRSDLDRLTEGKEGREILIVATWLRKNGKELTFEHTFSFTLSHLTIIETN